MLRGINVGGNRRIKMDALRQSFEALGFEQVKTFIQSGNAVYKSQKTSATMLSNKIEKRLFQDFGFSVRVISRTVDEMTETIENNPFVATSGLDREKFHVMFLSASQTPLAVTNLNAIASPPDQFRCIGKDIYLYLPNGAGESKFMKSPLDRLLSVVTTTRNWRSVNSLLEMCRDCR